MATSFIVVCPCCRARLTVDGELREVIAHETPPPKRAMNDVDAAVEALRTKAAEREARFRREMETQGQKGQLLERKFQEGLKKAKESPADARPVRPIDID